MKAPRFPPRILAGTPEKLAGWLKEIAAAFGTEEIMLQCITPDHWARLVAHQMLAAAIGLEGKAS